MLAMIGGIMLLCAVGAMLLLALWSIARDDEPDSQQRDGILALKLHSGASRRAKEAGPRRGAGSQRKAERGQAARRHAPRKRLPPKYDADEMAEIEAEAQANMPQFLREAREEY